MDYVVGVSACDDRRRKIRLSERKNHTGIRQLVRYINRTQNDLNKQAYVEE